MADLTVTLQRGVSERAYEKQRQEPVDEERERAERELALLQNNLLDSDMAARGLQQLATVQRQFEGSETGRLSAIAAASAAKAETTRMLAELLGESDKRAGIYAKEADERYAAGSSCERIYDKVTDRKQ